MDPLLSRLSSDIFRKLVQEQRPEWALGQERVGGFQSVNSPEVAEGRFAAPTPEEAELNAVKTALEEQVQPARRLWDALPGWLEKWGLQHRKDTLEEQKLPAAQRNQGGTGFDVLDLYGGEKLMPLLLGVMMGAKGAKGLGGLTQVKYILGKEALEKGEAPQSVWRKYGVAKTKEGDYMFEPPLQVGESDALRQFQQAYPEETLRVLQGQGTREGYFWQPGNEIFAQGRTDVPITDFQSRRRVLEHELQHKIDSAEGRSSGTNLQDPLYYSNAAEVRARNAETRLDPAERVWEPSMTEDTSRLEQIIQKHPGAMAEAVKEKGGMWHPEAVERLAAPLQKSLSGYERYAVQENLDIGEALKPGLENIHNWSGRAIRNYLNKHAGTATDPLKDVEVPFGEGVKRWEELMDWSIGKANKEGLEKGQFWSPFPGSEKMKPGEEVYHVSNFTGGAGHGSYTAIQSYLSHVGDYLRQNVKPEKLQQYDLVRAVKETAANDARIAKEMEKAAAASMKDMPVYKDYGDGYKWVELKKPEKLSEEQTKGVQSSFKVRESGHGVDSDAAYVAVDAKGKPIENSYTGRQVTGRTPEEAHLAGQLAQEGNQMGHCVGGYCEGVASGESRIFSLRDAKGRSHVTVEVAPNEKFPVVGSGGDPNLPPNILQIKGKQNRAPSAEYLPYVQDFVRSGKWGEVGDLGNTGLRAAKRKGSDKIEYLTPEEASGPDIEFFEGRY